MIDIHRESPRGRRLDMWMARIAAFVMAIGVFGVMVGLYMAVGV